VCAAFDCGDADVHRPINNWIREWIWEGRWARLRERTLLGFETGDADDNHPGQLVGYGTWDHRAVTTSAGVHTAIEIAWFGIDRQFQKRRTADGRSYASQLYATLEADARADSASVDEMELILECHVDNEAGRGFWESRGYRVIPDEEVVVYEPDEAGRPYHRMVR
jgi:ribosomal protein S18 acetylase RimI-like enzyme